MPGERRRTGEPLTNASKTHLKSRLAAWAVSCVAGAAAVGCGGSPTAPTAATQSQAQTGVTTTPPAASVTPPPPVAPPVAPEAPESPVASLEETVFSGAGDIADIKYLANARATAELLRALPGPKFTAGDNVQDTGSMREYLDYWQPTWGTLGNEIFPTIGNHDRQSAYFDYFGSRAGPFGLGYYSYDLGRSWHVLSLNSNDSSAIGGAQYAWVAQDLAANTRPCTIAIWHHPTVSSGENADERTMENIRRLLYRSGAEIVINGHNHTYERMLPSDDAYRRNDRFGLTQFVVGTGGYALYSFKSIAPNSAIRFNQDHGVLSLTLRAGSYSWQFITVKSGAVDTGSGTCHQPPSAATAP
jgi:hypothetical protein